MKGRLTIKQQKFVHSLVRTGSAQTAAREAFDIKNPNNSTAATVGHEYQNKPKIRAAIAEEFRKQDLTVEWVLNGLKNLAIDKNVEPSTRTRNLELIGRHLKMFTDKIQVDTPETEVDL